MLVRGSERSFNAPGASRAFLDADQVVDLVDQAAHRRGIHQFAHVVELAQTERTHARAVPALAAIDALEQADADRLACVRLPVAKANFSYGIYALRSGN